VTGRVAQRRRLAALAIIAAAGPPGVGRDRLIALLWPESTSEQARHRLADVLHVLRGTLGEDALRNSGDRVALNGEIVGCDLLRFEAALAAGDVEAASAAYGGALLDGFHVVDAPDFERWADAERDRVARQASRAFETLAERAAAAGDHATAVASWLRLAAHDPFSGRVTLRLMRALEAAGDRGGAIRQAAIHAALLREQMDADADPEVLALAERLRRVPARVSGPTASASDPTHPPAGSERQDGGRSTPGPLDAGDGDRDARSAGLPAATAAAGAASTERDAVRRAGGGWWRGIALATVLVAAGGWALGRQPQGRREVGPGVVAVLPFRTTGAPAVGYLREGMLDLLAAKLTGEGGLRALDAATVLASWRSAVMDERRDLPRADAIALGHRLRVGGVVEGTIVATPTGRLTLSAVLLAVPSGGVRGRAEVAGPVDSLPSLVDRLTAQLLVSQANPSGVPLETAATTSLPALRRYLDAQALVRRGRFDEAVLHFGAALDEDSTFALAAIGEMEVSIFHGFQTPPPRLGRLGWRHRDRLGPRDRAYLVALVGGRRYPLPTPLPDRLLDWQAAVGEAPDRASAWSRLGDMYWHYGATVGVDSFAHRAAAAFERAIALDSSYAPAYVHLIDIAALRRDTVAARRWLRAYAAADSAAYRLDGYRWVVATAIGDSATVHAVRARMPSLSSRDLDRIALWALQSALGARDAERALDLMWTRVAAAPATAPAMGVSWRRAELLFGLGRPAAARRALLATPMDSTSDRRLVVQMSLVSGADTSAAVLAARALAASGDGSATDRPGRTERLMDACYAALWRLSRGDTEYAVRTAERLRAADSTTIVSAALPAAERCAMLLEAQLAVTQRSPATAGALERLDASMRTRPYQFLDLVANLFLAREWEARGDHARALRTVRRREWNVVFTAAPQFREEARLAARLGDRKGAIRAYQAYLALHHDPEPELRSEVARARAELARLTGPSVQGAW
jgi:DNA-binding SARP family transcriptional activator